MNNYLIAVTACLAACFLCACAAPSGESRERLAKEEVSAISSILGPLKELNEKVELLVQHAVVNAEDLTPAEVAKRQQGAWDMDYGWGGGRFGKRAPSKRYDMYGIGGRFGRDVSRVQQARQADLHQ